MLKRIPITADLVMAVSLGLFLPITLFAEETVPNIRTIPMDLVVPEMVSGEPAAGRRIRGVLPEYFDTDIHHALYLPNDWVKGRLYPVLVEYAGNGPFRNRFGDVSTGRLDDSSLGYGISGGEKFIWICLPFISQDHQRNQRQWWGDVEATVNYCIQAVDYVCKEFGGDRSALFLTGFSRGSIACNFIGLHNDEIASLWKGFICHSHYDGVQLWNYSGSDGVSALERLTRLKGRPQFITHEASVDATQKYLNDVHPDGNFTFTRIPFKNHTDSWVLRGLTERTQLRNWLRDLIE